MTHELMLCQCGDPSHQLIIFYDDDEISPRVYICVHLVNETNFFKRLWYGLKYIFSNKRSIYGDFDEIILKPEDADKLQRAVNILKGLSTEVQLPIFLNLNQLPS